MQNDALTAGVKPGGLIDKTEIRLLICYILAKIDQPIHREVLVELLWNEGIANYFELSDAVGALVEAQQIVAVDDEEAIFVISETGRDIADTLHDSLPLTMRQKAVRTTLRTLAKIRHDGENKVSITKAKSGGYNVKCTVLEEEAELMSVSLLVPDKLHANTIKQHFIDDPIRLYCAIVAEMTGDYRSVKEQFEAITREMLRNDF